MSVYIRGHRLKFSNTNCYSFFEDCSYGILVGASLSIYRLQAEGTLKAICFAPSYNKKAPMVSCSRKRKTCIRYCCVNRLKYSFKKTFSVVDRFFKIGFIATYCHIC